HRRAVRTTPRAPRIAHARRQPHQPRLHQRLAHLLRTGHATHLRAWRGVLHPPGYAVAGGDLPGIRAVRARPGRGYSWRAGSLSSSSRNTTLAWVRFLTPRRSKIAVRCALTVRSW